MSDEIKRYMEQGEEALKCHPDYAANDIGTSASDMIASILHLVSTGYGYEPKEILDRGWRTYVGDASAAVAERQWANRRLAETQAVNAAAEAQDEQLLDKRVQRRLASDHEYRNAENAEQQAEREREIEEEEVKRLQLQREGFTPDHS